MTCIQKKIPNPKSQTVRKYRITHTILEARKNLTSSQATPNYPLADGQRSSPKTLRTAAPTGLDTVVLAFFRVLARARANALLPLTLVSPNSPPGPLESRIKYSVEFLNMNHAYRRRHYRHSCPYRVELKHFVDLGCRPHRPIQVAPATSTLDVQRSLIRLNSARLPLPAGKYCDVRRRLRCSTC